MRNNPRLVLAARILLVFTLFCLRPALAEHVLPIVSGLVGHFEADTESCEAKYRAWRIRHAGKTPWASVAKKTDWPITTEDVTSLRKKSTYRDDFIGASKSDYKNDPRDLVIVNHISDIRARAHDDELVIVYAGGQHIEDYFLHSADTKSLYVSPELRKGTLQGTPGIIEFKTAAIEYFAKKFGRIPEDRVDMVHHFWWFQDRNAKAEEFHYNALTNLKLFLDRHPTFPDEDIVSNSVPPSNMILYGDIHRTYDVDTFGDLPYRDAGAGLRARLAAV